MSDQSRVWQYAVGGLIGAAVLVIVLGLVFSRGRPPQMGTSEEVFRTVDALYTAVRNHDEKRLSECEQRLHGYREAGKLPAAAADRLDRIIRTARDGEWQSAAERLYDFMLGQRREADIEHQPKSEPVKGKKK